MKEERQEKILNLIRNYDIKTQEELIRRLEDAGYRVTQATVSRDIRELKLTKGVSPSGGYRYILPTRPERSTPDFASSLTVSVTHVDSAGHLLVVRTYPGMANAVAACIDSMRLNEIIGSVAGDDTIIAVVRTEADAVALCEKIRLMVESH